jgi:hypothetical protein
MAIKEEYISLISGAISGLVEVQTTHPIDVIKTKLQQSTLNINQTIKHIYKTHGLIGFYNGLIPRLIGIVPMRIVYWNSQYYSTKYYLTLNFSYQSSLILGGLSGGILQTIIDNPIETIKTRMINGSNLTTAIKLPYYGFGATLLRNSIFAVSMNYISNKYKVSTNKYFLDLNTIVFDYSIILNFFIGAIGGLIGSVITQPFDYIKTQLQSIDSYNKIEYKLKQKEILNKAYNNLIKNPSYLMKGWQPRAFLCFMNMGIGSVIFHTSNEYLTKKMN